MHRILRIAGSVFLSLAMLAAADRRWVLEQSTLTYHVSHPLHQTEGVSHAAKGKGICNAGECNFLIAALVKSFDSRDSNRDLHLLQAARGAQFPMVSVRTRLPETSLVLPTIVADLEIQFAGQTSRSGWRRSLKEMRLKFPERFRPRCRISRSTHPRCSPFLSGTRCACRNDMASAVGHGGGLTAARDHSKTPAGPSSPLSSPHRGQVFFSDPRSI